MARKADFGKASDLPLLGFPEGVHNVPLETNLPDGAARELKNVDVVGPEGKIRRRRGYDRKVTTTYGRSMFSYAGKLFFADRDQLSVVQPPDFDPVAITSVHPSEPVCFEVINDQIYFTDGLNAGIIRPDLTVLPWAPEQPTSQPALSALPAGALPVGRYQVAVTFLRGREESGTGRAVTVDLPTVGSIQLSNIPQPQRADTTAVRLYVTNTSGEVLYRHRELPVGTTGAVISDLPQGAQLTTQFLEPMPAGSLVRMYRGRLYTAYSNMLFFSEPLHFGLHRPTHNYIVTPAPIDMIRPVDGGIYVGTAEKVNFYTGENPSRFTTSVTHAKGVVRGTDLLLPAFELGVEAQTAGDVAVWWSKAGYMVVGLANGQTLPIRHKDLALPEFSRGAIIHRTENGARQLLSVLSGAKRGNSLAAADTASITVYRNGIEI